MTTEMKLASPEVYKALVEQYGENKVFDVQYTKGVTLYYQVAFSFGDFTRIPHQGDFFIHRGNLFFAEDIDPDHAKVYASVESYLGDIPEEFTLTEDFEDLTKD